MLQDFKRQLLHWLSFLRPPAFSPLSDHDLHALAFAFSWKSYRISPGRRSFYVHIRGTMVWNLAGCCRRRKSCLGSRRRPSHDGSLYRRLNWLSRLFWRHRGIQGCLTRLWWPCAARGSSKRRHVGSHRYTLQWSSALFSRFPLWKWPSR